MKKALISMVFAFTLLNAGTDLETGAYVSFADPDSTISAPTYLYFAGDADYTLFDSLDISALAKIRVGFPKKLAPDQSPEINSDNLLYSSYGTGGLRAAVNYRHTYFSVGTATQLSLSPSRSYNRIIKTEFMGYRTFAISQNLFASATPIDGMYADFTMAFSHARYRKEVDTEFNDSNLYINFYAEYLPITYIGPFVKIGNSDDLIERETHNWTDLLTGITGYAKTDDNLFRVMYEVYYRYLISGIPPQEEGMESTPNRMVSDNNRFGLYAKARYATPIDMDLFAWTKLEYAAASDGTIKYVERSVSLMVRQWFFNHRFYLSGGSHFFFEKGYQDVQNGNLVGGFSTDSIYVPVWPFAEIGWNNGTLKAYAQYSNKFSMAYHNQQSAIRTYRATQQRIKAGISYRFFDWLDPVLEFYYNDVINFTFNDVDSLGLTVGIAAHL